MKFSVISIYDKKSGAYDKPVFTRYLSDVIREWDIIIKDQNTKFGKNPEDFSLVQIGQFDDDNGTFENEVPHKQIT